MVALGEGVEFGLPQAAQRKVAGGGAGRRGHQGIRQRREVVDEGGFQPLDVALRPDAGVAGPLDRERVAVHLGVDVERMGAAPGRVAGRAG